MQTMSENPVFPTLLLLVVLAAWLVGRRLLTRRTPVSGDEQAEPVQDAGGWGQGIRVLIVLFVLYLVIEIITIQILGQNAKNTVSRLGEEWKNP